MEIIPKSIWFSEKSGSFAPSFCNPGKPHPYGRVGLLTLEDVRAADSKCLRTPGVYIALNFNLSHPFVYVGQSVFPRSRILDHLKNSAMWIRDETRFAIITTPPFLLDVIERRLTLALTPLCNKTTPVPCKFSLRALAESCSLRHSNAFRTAAAQVGMSIDSNIEDFFYGMKLFDLLTACCKSKLNVKAFLAEVQHGSILASVPNIPLFREYLSVAIAQISASVPENDGDRFFKAGMSNRAKTTREEELIFSIPGVTEAYSKLAPLITQIEKERAEQVILPSIDADVAKLLGKYHSVMGGDIKQHLQEAIKQYCSQVPMNDFMTVKLYNNW